MPAHPITNQDQNQAANNEDHNPKMEYQDGIGKKLVWHGQSDYRCLAFNSKSNSTFD